MAEPCHKLLTGPTLRSDSITDLTGERPPSGPRDHSILDPHHPLPDLPLASTAGATEEYQGDAQQHRFVDPLGTAFESGIDIPLELRAQLPVVMYRPITRPRNLGVDRMHCRSPHEPGSDSVGHEDPLLGLQHFVLYCFTDDGERHTKSGGEAFAAEISAPNRHSSRPMKEAI